MKQYIKLKKDAIGEVELIEEAHIRGLDNKASRAQVFIETEEELPAGKAIKFLINPPGKDETYVAYGVIDESCNQSSGGKPSGVAITVLEIERASTDEQVTGEEEEPSGTPGRVLETPVSLPDAQKIKEVLGSLIGMEVEIEESDSDPSEGAKSVATFVTDSGAIGAVCICDMRLTGKIGAALDLVPAEEIEQHIQSGELPENIINNFKEAMNVAASLFNSDNSVHLSSGEVLINPEKLNADISIVVKKAASRAIYKVTIPNYDDGIMAFYSAP